MSVYHLQVMAPTEMNQWASAFPVFITSSDEWHDVETFSDHHLALKEQQLLARRWGCQTRVVIDRRSQS